MIFFQNWIRGGEFAQPWGIPVYKTCLSVNWSWLDFCVLPSRSLSKVSPPLGFRTRFAIQSLEDRTLHVPECVWQCYHHYQPLTTLSAEWSFQDFALWTEYINWSEYELELPVWNCVSVGDGRVYLRSAISFFTLFLRRISLGASEPRSQPWGGRSLIRTYRNGFKKIRKYPLTFHWGRLKAHWDV